VRSRSRRWILLLIGLAIVALGLAVLDGYMQSYRFARDLEAAYPKLAAVRDQLRQGRPPTQRSLRSAAQAVADLRREVDGARFTFRLTGAIPFAGRPVQAVRLATSAAGEAQQASSLAATVVRQLLGGPGLVHDGTVDLARLTGQAGRVTSIRNHLRAALTDVQAIPHVPFVSKLDRLKSDAVGQLTSAARLAGRAVLGFRLLPDFLGANGPRTYFLAMQNNADQRATGGAVLAYGLIRMDQGRVRLLRSGSILELDRTPAVQHLAHPPYPIKWYLKFTRHLPLINSGLNFTPDFPMVARMWAIQAGKASNTQIDGVIGLDPVGVADAMRGQGSFRVPIFSDPIDSHSVVRVVESTQYTLPHEQQVLVPKALVAGAFHLLTSPRDLLSMGQGLGTALADKRVQLWFRDATLEGLVKSLDWDGALDPGEGDFLFLVQDKRVTNKVDFYSRQEITYSLRLSSSGNGRASALLRLINDTPPGLDRAVVGRVLPYGLNASMLNLYVPKRAHDLKVKLFRPLKFVRLTPRAFRQHLEGSTRVYTKHVEAWPGHPGQLLYRYEIPEAARCMPDGTFAYRLRLRHQPVARPTVIHVRVELPTGSRVVEARPNWSVRGDVAELRMHLNRDTDMLMRYETPSGCG
jgi:hypothetical protein